MVQLFDVSEQFWQHLREKCLSFKVFGTFQTQMSDLGWKQTRRFTIPILNNFAIVPLLPQLLKYLPLLSTTQNLSQISYRSKFQIAPHINNVASNFTKERRGHKNCKKGEIFYMANLSIIINSTSFVCCTTVPNKIT